VNTERARLGHTVLGAGVASDWLFRCECGEPTCGRRLELSLGEFDDARRSGQPLVAPGHAVTRARALRADAVGLTEEAAALAAQAEQLMRHGEAVGARVADGPARSFRLVASPGGW
jgi:hypothetical protein